MNQTHQENSITVFPLKLLSLKDVKEKLIPGNMYYIFTVENNHAFLRTLSIISKYCTFRGLQFSEEFLYIYKGFFIDENAKLDNDFLKIEFYNVSNHALEYINSEKLLNYIFIYDKENFDTNSDKHINIFVNNI